MPATPGMLRALLRLSPRVRRGHRGRGARSRPTYRAAALTLLAAGVATSAGAATAPAPAAAGTSAPLYAVEIIVFRDTVVGPSEDWSAPPPARGFGDTSVAGPPPQLVRMLSPSDYRLGGVLARLRRSSQYQPVAHAAWVQTASSWGSNEGLSLSLLGIHVPGLHGTVYLERAQFLHLGMQLDLGMAPTYRIDEMRTVSFHQLQYFDHPAFGIIAEVTPVS